MKTLAALALALCVTTPLAAQEFTTDFDVERCTFASHGRQNPYFSLQPGDQVTLEGEDDGEEIKVEITVKRGTKTITFRTPDGATKTVRARVVEEKEWKDGELAEVSRNWFARCIETNDVFYFGESVDFYEDGRISGHGGSWQAGVNGAQPGIIIPARFLLGARYFQEIASEDEAMDRAENVEMGLTVTAAGETFEDCVKVRETSPLEPGGESFKVYCPGVGMVQDDEIVLTDFQRD